MGSMQSVVQGDVTFLPAKTRVFIEETVCKGNLDDGARDSVTTVTNELRRRDCEIALAKGKESWKEFWEGKGGERRGGLKGSDSGRE